MKAIRGVLFDLGGTLRILEPNEAHQARAWRRMAELTGIEDADVLRERLAERYERYRVWALEACAEAGDYELWANWLLPELAPERLAAHCRELSFQYRQTKGLRRVADGGVELLRTLKARGYRLGIISNLIGEDEIPDWLQTDGLTDCFDAVVLSSVCHIRKPDPRIYHIACREMGLPPAACASVGDNLKRDITGARAAGIGSVVLIMEPDAFSRCRITAENRPDAVVPRLCDLAALDILRPDVR